MVVHATTFFERIGGAAKTLAALRIQRVYGGLRRECTKECRLLVGQRTSHPPAAAVKPTKGMYVRTYVRTYVRIRAADGLRQCSYKPQ